MDEEKKKVTEFLEVLIEMIEKGYGEDDIIDYMIDNIYEAKEAAEALMEALAVLWPAADYRGVDGVKLLPGVQEIVRKERE